MGSDCKSRSHSSHAPDQSRRPGLYSSFGDESSREEESSRESGYAESILRHYFRVQDSSAAHLADEGEAEQIGSSICGGRYRLERFLGEGAFGIVHLAFDTTLARYVAIKLPRPRSLASPMIYDRAVMEARHIAALDHPHIVHVHEVVDVAGVPMIVSAYCDGMTLTEWLTRQPVGRATPRDAAIIIRDLAGALAHAHQRGVLHRDIKPSNVWIRNTSGEIQPMLMDFGLSRRIEGDVGLFNGPCGTDRYMAPEVKASHGQLDSTVSDLYSLGTAHRR